MYGDNLLSRKALEAASPTDGNHSALLSAWLEHLRIFNVFFSAPLDLDMSMLTAFSGSYSNFDGNGPSEVGDSAEAVLGKGYEERGSDPSLDYRTYRYLFLGRGKPVTHVRVLAKMSD